jgi:hypothetical protein
VGSSTHLYEYVLVGVHGGRGGGEDTPCTFMYVWGVAHTCMDLLVSRVKSSWGKTPKDFYVHVENIIMGLLVSREKSF